MARAPAAPLSRGAYGRRVAAIGRPLAARCFTRTCAPMADRPSQRASGRALPPQNEASMDTPPVIVTRAHRPLHPLHLLLVTSAFPLFVGALTADIAYARTYEIQWTNFASWLLVGAMVFATVGLVWALVSLALPTARTRTRLLYAGALALTWVLGLLNSLVHAMDAWQKMPQALVWSVLCVVSIGATLWFALGGTLRRGEVL